MSQLTAKQISLPVVTQPQQFAPFVKPVSYDFRVVEHIEDGKVARVALQMQIWEHDEYGSGTVKSYWHDVPRVKMDSNGAILNPYTNP